MKTKLITLLILTAVLAACGTPATELPAGQGPVYIDSADLLILESFPIQLRLVLAGNLPTPCHELAYEIAAANTENQIHVALYANVDPAARCMQVLQPFDEGIAIPLDGLPDGEYSVWVNGELVGEFSYPG